MYIVNYTDPSPNIEELSFQTGREGVNENIGKENIEQDKKREKIQIQGDQNKMVEISLNKAVLPRSVNGVGTLG